MGGSQSIEEAGFKDEAFLSINGKQYNVNNSVPVDTSLNTFIRNHANLKGTKAMCHEGGCGACIVMVTMVHPVTKKETSLAVNSCLMPVLSCHGWEITTIEGIGNKKTGHNVIQKRLANFNGTQCGYCSPGMVMNMYSLLQNDKNITMKEVENSFGGNICRCTGYRPILDAFKSLSSDAPAELKYKYPDIEDVIDGKVCPKNGNPCSSSCKTSDQSCLAVSGSNTQQKLPEVQLLHLKMDTAEWFKVDKVADIFKILDTRPDKNYMFIAGNTAHGVYRRDPTIKTFIDINNVEELKTYSVSSELVIGGNMTLTEVMELFYELPKSRNGFKYTKVLADHIDLVANVPVRNTGTIAGNLSIKHRHLEFPSDIFLILEAVDAKINIADRNGYIQSVCPAEFLNMDMRQKIITSITLPQYDDSYYLKTYKIMPRSQNAHAYVNAGFLFKLDRNFIGEILLRPRIVFGGIHPDLIHANALEQYLDGKNIYDQEVLLTALSILDSELLPDYMPPDAIPEYRKGLAEGLFYKFVLSISPENVTPAFRSGGFLIKRSLSSGKQEFDTQKELWPLGKPVPKLEALVQCSGEAQYVNDVLTIPGELYCAFAVTTIANGHIKSTDPQEALAVPGVVAYYEAKDIPGKNSFIQVGLLGLTDDEEILCSGDVKFNGQPVGIIVADSHNTAVKAAKLVKIEYDLVNQPILLLREALESGDEKRVKLTGEIKPTDTERKKKTKHVIKGSFDIGSQYHYTMETQCAICIPTEDGIDVFAATQWMDLTQIAISNALKIPENSINIQVRRLGGAYGAKISRNSLVSTACSLVAYLQNKPARFILPLETNMESVGKRFDCAMDYEVGVDDNGSITYMEANMYHNNGCSTNDNPASFSLLHIDNCYDKTTWHITSHTVFTDIPTNTWCRAPASTEGIAFAENIMEHIAAILKKDPNEIRRNNLSKEDNTIEKMMKYWKKESDYIHREQVVKAFNKANRWRKRGISLVPMRYGFLYFGNYHAIVSIYAADGTVSVSHGGIEMGQGINTKVAQVCAHALGIPMELVSIKPSNVLTAPNNMTTGGSIGSESCAYATLRACEELLKRLAPIKEKLKNPTWPELILQAQKENVDLCSTFMMYAGINDAIKHYYIYGVTITEVEVDILTGQQQVLRVDLLEDAGESMSPEVDIGQVEGAFVMGLGYWLKEYMAYDKESGKALTNRTWNYKPPGAKDIPIDFRIQLRKNAPNPVGVLRSKATGEPPLCMSISALFAVRKAVHSARYDAGNIEDWFEMTPPATPERVFLTSLVDYKQFGL